MYEFSWSEDRIFSAINKDDCEHIVIADNINWFREYDNVVIALTIDENYSDLYKISKTSLNKERVARVRRNIKELKEGIIPVLTYDKVIVIEFKEPYLVCVIRKNYRSLGFSDTLKDCLIVTNTDTKETKQLYEWNPKGEDGFVGIGIPDCYEEPEVTLDDEWINIRTTFKKPTRDYWVTNGAYCVQDFKVTYDGLKRTNLLKNK